jgi:hemoglobin
MLGDQFKVLLPNRRRDHMCHFTPTRRQPDGASPTTMMHHPDRFELDRPAIAMLVRRFYADVRADARLGPIFNGAIGEHWPAHLDKLTDFWCTVMLASGQYQGNVYGKHMALDAAVDADHFTRWLALFERHVHAMFAPAVCAEFMTVARRIAASLQLGMLNRDDGAPVPSIKVAQRKKT